ncbi:MAG: NADH-quinone oxidoreductase subunit H [Coriobacteriales bacterium]|jgi:hydrogenase-4 component C|nr:NADH-quinone oxidoreductase subunit H [Coriobacteriales bacterium]
MIEILIACVQTLLLVALTPLVSGVGRFMRAKMHTRKGPPILQDYYDLAKLFKRQDIHTKDSSFVHRLMPPLFLGTMLVLALGMPMLTRLSPVPFLADVILIIYLLALPRFFFALSAIDSGSSYAGVGGIRELMVGVLVEPSMMLALFVAALSAGSTNVGVMGATIGSLSVAHPVTIIIVGFAFALACYVELGKLPYDLAEAEQELQEGPLSEYSGPSLAMVKMAMSLKQILVVSWFIAIFLPFGSAVELTVVALAIGLVVYLVKLALIFFICSVFENAVSRVRFKLLGRQTWAVFGIAVFGFVFWILGI